jgi:colicin import membrane protein
MAGADRTRVQKSVPRAEAERSARAAVDKTIQLADAPSPEPARVGNKRPLLVPAVLGVLVLSGAAAYFFVIKPSQQSAAQKVEVEAKAKRDAAEAAKAEAQAKRDVEVKAQREAQAKRDAEAQAKREANAQAQREAEAQAKRSAEAKGQRAAELKAKQEA